MAVLPILRGVFGVPVDQIDKAALDRVVDAEVAETEVLDWKQQYTRGHGEDIAADIVAMANNLGGVIVVGIAEDQHGHAIRLTPLSASVDSIKNAITQACVARIRPFLPGIEVREVPVGSGHCLVIAIPRSRDAPHGITAEKTQGKRHFSYPVRRGTTTHWMTESEIAAAYRDRFQARADTDAAALTLLQEGAAQVPVSLDDNVDPRDHPDGAANAAVWLAMSGAPSTLGASPAAGEARTRAIGFMHTWLRRALEIPGNTFSELDPARARVAVGRTVFGYRGRGATRTESHGPLVTLAHDGGGFTAQHLSREVLAIRRPSWFDPTRVVLSDEVEWTLFTNLSLLIEHALHTGASGELEVCARLCVRDTTHHAVAVPVPPSNNALPYEVRSDAIPQTYVSARVATPVIATATVPLDDYSHLLVARTVHVLATDILAEFGVDEPRLFGFDGHVTVAHVGPPLAAEGVYSWAEQNINAFI